MSVLSRSRQRPTVDWKRLPRRKQKNPRRFILGKAGQILKASDRLYRMTANGNFERGYISAADNKFHRQIRVRNHQRREAR